MSTPAASSPQPTRAEILRFTTAGSVDDGKSTLIGRLLHDSHAVTEDQLAAIQRITAQRGEAHLNLSLLTDGLRAEREQGINVDVAYRYFATSRRKFIIADTPGHIQYTRNMVTGASTAELAQVRSPPTPPHGLRATPTTGIAGHGVLTGALYPGPPRQSPYITSVTGLTSFWRPEDHGWCFPSLPTSIRALAASFFKQSLGAY